MDVYQTLNSTRRVNDFSKNLRHALPEAGDGARANGKFSELGREYRRSGKNKKATESGGVIPQIGENSAKIGGIVPNNVPNNVPKLGADLSGNKNTVTSTNLENMQVTGERMAIKGDVNGEKFVDVTEDIFNINSGESIARTIQKTISDRFNNLINVGGQKIQINKTTNDEFRRSENATKLLKKDPQKYDDKLKTIANADEILAAAKNWIGEEIGHLRKDDIVEFARADITYRVGNNGYVADVIVGTRKKRSCGAL